MFSPTKSRKVFFSISGVLVLLSIVLLIVRGLNYGIDFTGGSTLQFNLHTAYTQEIESDVRAIVQEVAGSNDISVQATGDTKEEISIKTIELTNEQSDEIITQIKEKYSLSQTDLLSNDKVSGTVSDRLIGDSLKAIFLALVLMLLYITFRFDFQSGSSAIVALAHDVIIMLGFYALFQVTVSNSFIAGILTIVGYSINATIIVFDRVRENVKTMRKASFDEIADRAIQSSYARAINSSLTTLFTIGVLYVIGVDSIREFALPIIIGILAGTYSSLFVAGPFWAWWKETGRKSKSVHNK